MNIITVNFIGDFASRNTHPSVSPNWAKLVASARGDFANCWQADLVNAKPIPHSAEYPSNCLTNWARLSALYSCQQPLNQQRAAKRKNRKKPALHKFEFGQCNSTSNVRNTQIQLCSTLQTSKVNQLGSG